MLSATLSVSNRVSCAYDYSARCPVHEVLETISLVPSRIILSSGVDLTRFKLGNTAGLACRETGRYEEGIAALKKSLQVAPNEVFARVILVGLYMYAGREDEARATVAEIQRIAHSNRKNSKERKDCWDRKGLVFCLPCVLRGEGRLRSIRPRISPRDRGRAAWPPVPSDSGGARSSSRGHGGCGQPGLFRYSDRDNPDRVDGRSFQ
jgi:hypothetical protein